MTVSEIAHATGARADFEGEVRCVCTDTRALEKDCLFVCIQGENFDGHSFAKAALKGGAAAVLCHTDMGCDRQIITDDTRTALLSLAGYYRSKFNIPVAGVTGSVGKTTIKEMTQAVFSEKYKTLKTKGNLNNEIGLPRTLFELDGSYGAAVIEMGMSALGEISRLSRTAQPTMGIIGNIGVSHLEKLGSVENILRAKLEITHGMADDAPLILNGDDARLYGAKLPGRPVYYFGINNKYCRFKAYDIQSTARGSSFILDFGCGEQYVELPAIGIHNIYNALAAFAAGFLIGASPESSARALGEYVPEGMRQRVREVGGITIIEDCYNASPDSVGAAVKTLAQIKARRSIAVLGDMLELGAASESGHRLSGEMAACCGIDAVFATGERSKATVQAAAENGVKTAEHFTDRELLAKRICEEIQPGDAVLFKASRGIKLEEIMNKVYEEIEKHE